MKGLELAKIFYQEQIKPMLHEYFAEYEERIAVGLVGEGSECFGYDDELSKDHDHGKRLCIWITEDDDQKIGFALMEEYQRACENIGIIAPSRSGVFTIEQFYCQIIGCPSVPSAPYDWMTIPEHALANAVNGSVFRDDLGEFSSIRNELLKGFPQDVTFKKLSAHLTLMAQSGQYNYRRCIKRCENGAAALALHEFINHTFHVLFLLNQRYTPYYKWRFRAAKELPFLSNIVEHLETLTQNISINKNNEIIEHIASRITSELHRRGLTFSNDLFLETQAIELTKQIKNPSLKKLHLMEFGAD